MKDIKDIYSIAAEIPDYVQYLGLSYDPFAANAHYRSFITEAFGHQQEVISHLAQYSKYIIVVEAPQGGGKTRWWREINQINAKRMKVCAFNASNAPQVADLMKILADSFELPWHDDGDVAVTLSTKEGDSRPWVVLVDDADKLAPSVLLSLLKLTHADDVIKEPLHLILFASPDIKKALVSGEIADLCRGRLHRVSISSFNLRETQSFIEHLLLEAGMEQEFPFSKTQVAKIYHKSKGLPGLIINSVRQELGYRGANSGSAANTKGKRIPMKYQLMFIGILLSTILGIQIISMVSKSTASQTVVANASGSHNNREITLALDSSKKSSSFNVDDIAPELELKQQKPTVEVFPKYKDPASSIETAIAREENRLNLEINTGNEATAAGEVAESLASPSEPAGEIAAIAKLENKPAEIVTLTPKAQKPQPTVKIKSKLSESTALLDKNPHHFALQVLAVSNRKSLVALTEKYGSKYDLQIVKTKRKGEDWFLLIVGEYKTRDSAKAAINNLPTEFRASTPWIRSYESIKQVAVK